MFPNCAFVGSSCATQAQSEGVRGEHTYRSPGEDGGRARVTLQPASELPCDHRGVWGQLQNCTLNA